ncbi:PAS domain S-box protein [Chondrinema litorale]|uniref:PAS domain S-box protein n=1 Tax=Chondrinema litorale TaxID=2994555 RepID=UPI0025435A51|nr:PAS domain S-box protein [Chondrinema litorale]UZR98960.1 PAS domain S-box protein [Chondrinema litorale]
MDLQHIRSIVIQLERAPEEVDLIINTSIYAVCITNFNGVYTSVNDKYLSIYLYSKQDLLGKHFTIVVPEPAKELMKEMYEDFLISKENATRMWTVITKNKKSLTVNLTAVYTEAFNLPHRVIFMEQVEN